MSTDSRLKLPSALKTMSSWHLVYQALQATLHWLCVLSTSKAFPQKPKHLFSVAPHACPAIPIKSLH